MEARDTHTHGTHVNTGEQRSLRMMGNANFGPKLRDTRRLMGGSFTLRVCDECNLYSRGTANHNDSEQLKV